MFKIRAKDIFFLLLYSIPNTILSFGILYIINNALSGNEGFLRDYMGMVFIAIIIYTYLLNIIFQKRLNQYSFKRLYENEKLIFSKMLQTPLVKLEKLGTQRFYTAVEDLRIFAWLPETITHSVNSLLMLLLCMVYLFTLSVTSALIVVALIGVIAGIYFIVINKMSNSVQSLRMQNEKYFELVDDVIKGFKKLKISPVRTNKLMDDYLIPNRDKAESLDFNVQYIFLSINLISQYGLYFVIAVILFLLPEFGLLSRESIISYVVILLFIAGPINNLINMQNAYTRFLVAYNRIKKFLADFENPNKQIADSNQSIDFQSLEFEDVSFSYESDSLEKSFALGPLNLTINKGEVIFVVGGNGSGKSTFINLLTGLYQPKTGRISITAENSSDPVSGKQFQNAVSVIFTDNHIFANDYETFSVTDNPQYRELLKLMKLENVVQDDSEASARRKFSKGQSKRMSMTFALLEKKPVLILDEWAADQDPHFRKYFYETLIPKLKKEGKTIIAVTHDDAYFKHADRIIKFDYGKIVKDVAVAEEALVESMWY